jgi:uncharacterized protein (TIGR02147 family)
MHVLHSHDGQSFTKPSIFKFFGANFSVNFKSTLAHCTSASSANASCPAYLKSPVSDQDTLKPTWGIGKMQAVSEATRPDIYRYYDYRLFLKDWFAYLRDTRVGFSVRSLARSCGLSESYVSMVLSGERSLSERKLNRLAPCLGLDQSQQSYLSWLRTLLEADEEQQRLEALKKIQRFARYRELNPHDIENYEYLTHWYYVVIREMSALPDFNLDPVWIRARLKNRIGIDEIRDAIKFLTEHGYIELDPKGKCQRPSKPVHGKTGVVKPALIKFHREMLSQACDSIENTPREQRNVSAHTATIPIAKIVEVQKIMEEARNKIVTLISDTSDPTSEVYHFAFLAFPVTKSRKGSES